jgi:hypothetical protein
MTAIRSKRESGVPQTPQVLHGLTVGWPAKSRILLNCLLEPGVGNFALGKRLGSADEAYQRGHEQGWYGLHCR